MINLNLDLVEMGVHNEGADEDKDEVGRETHFENWGLPTWFNRSSFKTESFAFLFKYYKAKKHNSHVPTSAFSISLFTQTVRLYVCRKHIKYATIAKSNLKPSRRNGKIYNWQELGTHEKRNIKDQTIRQRQTWSIQAFCNISEQSMTSTPTGILIHHSKNITIADVVTTLSRSWSDLKTNVFLGFLYSWSNPSLSPKCRAPLGKTPVAVQ